MWYVYYTLSISLSKQKRKKELEGEIREEVVGKILCLNN